MPAKRPEASLNVLFIGNSFTGRNDLPKLIANLAAAAGKTMRHQLISVGGASLRTHWNKADALHAIQRGGYDYVVLQEQSTLPIKNPQRMRENVLLFDQAIKAAGSKTALYLTWARAHAPDSQEQITSAYASIAREIDATLIPAGIAWQKHLAEDEPITLHDKDASHPMLTGSFLAACVALIALFGEQIPEKIPPVEALTSAEMRRLVRTANATLKPSPRRANRSSAS
jgi:hypothetical protein